MFTVSGRRSIRVASIAATALAAGTLVVLGQTEALAASTATVNGSTSYQRIDGFGFSEAFQRSELIHNLPSANQQKVLDLLFDQTSGAGFSILRNGIGSSPDNSSDWMRSIAPTNPGSPSATPTWVWDGSDNSQVWLSKQAMSYGVQTIYADAWSAPGYMKTNNSDSGGGTLCGVPGATCASGDWRQAYANVLAKYLDLYAEAGVPITHVGFLNEPGLSTSYASMLSNGAQAADFIKVLSETLTAAGSTAKIVCCDAEGWSLQNDMLNTIASDPAAMSALSVASAHGYTSAPTFPFSQSSKPVWETEWSTFNGWDADWDNSSDSSGYSWAGRVMTALTSANVSAFLYWWGAAEKANNESLIRLDGDSYSVSARLWALANYSRFIRPDAVRIAASGTDGNVKLAAFKNADGSVVVVALNGASSASSMSFTLANTGVTSGTATPYLTNSGNGTAAQNAIAVSGGAFSASIPARSLVTYKITGSGLPSSPPSSASPPSSPPATGTSCKIAYTTNAWNSGLTAAITIANTGSTPVDGWSLAFTLPSGQVITSGWNATYSPVSGTVTATNATYNATIPANGSVSIGFQASHTGNTDKPALFALNGAACTDA
ncbi:MAG: cellulose-binding protein [Dactylosporangium sp.]|nr:cellulose binding domain-containing protein [Dactylosporangium sp.]NNJ61034.1 cellulose-binding protein [Dactylosporangium sp.]